MSNLIGQEWERYKERVVPATAKTVQVEATQLAFYAGAKIMFNLMINGVSEGDDVNPQDLQMLVDIQAELEAFFVHLLEKGK